MTTKEEIKILLPYIQLTRERPGTAYGSESGQGVLECRCCGALVNVGTREHKKDCKAQEAMTFLAQSRL